ncbi:MAG: hypothetical protein QW172_05720, partial [Candidatus Bathyarchaeia archaeon]
MSVKGEFKGKRLIENPPSRCRVSTMESFSEEPKKEGEEREASPSFREVYPLKEPHVYAAVSTDPKTLGLKYLVIEPTLTEEEKKALGRIKEILFQVLDVDLRSLGGREKAEEWLRGYVKRVVKGYKVRVGEGSLD